MTEGAGERHRRDEPIGPARVATCEARVRRFGEDLREEVLLRSGHLPERYEEARRSVVAALAQEAAAQEAVPLAEAYALAFVAERRRLASEEVDLASLGALPAIPEPPVLERAADRDGAAPDPGRDLARSVLTPPEPASVPAPPSAPEGARAPGPSAAAEAPRFVPSYLQGGATAVRPPERIPVPIVGVDVVGTEVAGLAPAGLAPAGLAPAGLDATQPPIRTSGPTLPFAQAPAGEVPDAARAASAAERAEPVAGADAEGAEEETRADGDATAFLPRRVFDEPATPFERNAAEAAPTMALDAEALRANARAPDPWISLDAYAAFLAELAEDPGRAPALRARFGIAGEDAQRALGAGFAAQFERDPALRVRFDALVRAERAKRRR